jgi:hypothetical protein
MDRTERTNPTHLRFLTKRMLAVDGSDLIVVKLLEGNAPVGFGGQFAAHPRGERRTGRCGGGRGERMQEEGTKRRGEEENRWTWRRGEERTGEERIGGEEEKKRRGPGRG